MNNIYNKLKTVFTCLLLSFAFTGCPENKSDETVKIEASQSDYIDVEKGKLFFQKFGTGEPIIVLHGGPGLDHNYLLPQMLELAKDHELIFYDQRGSGKSLETPFQPQYINIEQFSKDLNQLAASLGLKKFILMGHSWGGLLAMHYTINYPDNVSNLILVNSAPADYKGQQAFVNEFDKRTKQIKEKVKPLFNYEDFVKLDETEMSNLYRTLFSVYFNNPKDSRHLTLNINKESAQSGFKVMEEMSKTFWIRPNTDLFPYLKTLNVPTLVIHGKQDIVPWHTAQEIKEAIPHAKIFYLENCGHFPFIEKPQQFFSAVRRFLQNRMN